MRSYEAATMTELHNVMISSLVHAKADELDVISNVDVQVHNVMGYAHSMDWKMDLKTYWLTKSRWSMMVRQYLDPDQLQAWIEQCTTKIGTKGRGIAVLRTNVVKPRGGAATGHTNKETRRWGSCMLTLSYKAKPKPQITLHSRTSYLGYIGALDLSVAWMAAKYLAHEMGIKVEDISFLWYNEAIQWHNFKSMAWMLCNPDDGLRQMYRRLLTAPPSKLNDAEAGMIDDSPAINMTRGWLRKVRVEDRDGKTYGDMTYNTYRRIRRRWHTEVLGYEKAQTFEGWSYYKVGEKKGEQKEYFKAYLPLPSVWIDTCDFSAIKMPIGQKYGGDFVAGEDEDEDDDEE
jgi:hypothetical protein